MGAQRLADDGASMMGLVAFCAFLGFALVPVALAISAVQGGGGSPSEWLVRALVSGGVCWVAAALALASTYLGNRLQSPVPGLLLGMLFRMGLPLAAIMALPSVGAPLAPQGIATTILGVYLVALVQETGLSLRVFPATRAVKAT